MQPFTTLFSLTVSRDSEASSVTLTGTIPSSSIAEVRDRTLQHLAKEVDLDGFRKGEAPLSIVAQHFGDLSVWQRSAQEALTAHFPEILAEHSLMPIGPPQLSFTSVPVGGDVGFSLTFFVLPEITLPDYAALAASIPAKEVEPATDEEVSQVLLDIRRSLYKKAHPEKEIPEDVSALPEITDAHIQELSTTYSDTESFEKGLRENITSEKQMQAQARRRDEILSAIVKHTPFTVPSLLIDEEFKRTYEQFTTQISHLGSTVEEYLTSQNLTQEKLEEQMRAEGEKRSRVQLILNAISVKENILPDSEMVAKETERLKGRLKDLSEEEVRQYVASLLTNDAVLSFLESQSS